MKDTYWEKLGESGNYQMGPQGHRVELANILKAYQVRTVLEVGCGTGSFFEVLRDSGWIGKYKGTDYTERFVDTCKKNFPGINWEVQDARKLKEKDNSWDAIVLVHTLDHIDKYYEALEEAYRVCKKYVFIVLWRPFAEGADNNLNSSGFIDNHNYEDTHLIDFNKQVLDMDITEAGFNILDEQEIGKEKYNYLYVLEKGSHA